MASIEQIHALNDFIQNLPAGQRDKLSIDEIYERWREQAFQHEDLLAIKSSLRDYVDGERGRPVEAFLANFDAAPSQRASEEVK